MIPYWFACLVDRIALVFGYEAMVQGTQGRSGVDRIFLRKRSVLTRYGAGPLIVGMPAVRVAGQTDGGSQI